MGVATTSGLTHVGQSIPRVDAAEKVRGLTQYIDDLPFPDAWHAAVVRSPVSHGRLRGLTFDPAFDWSSVCVVTPKDIPGENVVDMIGHDMPFIAHDWIQYRGEPVALIAAPTKRLAEEAAALVKIDIDPVAPILTLAEVVERHKRGDDGLHRLASQTIRKGNVDAGLKSADLVIEGEYTAGHQEQLYIEPQGMVAIPEPDGGVFIQGSLQCPYYIAPELVPTLKLPLEKIRVKQTAVGGAFGGKEEFPTLIAGYCALLALKCRKPVKMIYDRHQDILYTTKRHPVWVKYTTGVKKSGEIVAMKVDFLLDGGAYTTLSPVVMYRGILHTTLGYRCPHVAVDGNVFRTNTFPCGAFRGFGAPQAIWGLESHNDTIAERLGMLPHEFRRLNALKLGDTTATGQKIFEPMGTPDVLDKTLKMAGFAKKLSHCSHGKNGGAKLYGIGVAFFGHGSGFTGDGESRLKSKAALDLEPDEKGNPVVNIRISSTEMGQGTLTIMPQIAADGLSVPIKHVKCPFPDTRFVPDSGPTVASRTAMVVGGTVFGAAQKLKTQLEAFVTDEIWGGEPAKLDQGVFRSSLTNKEISFEKAAQRLIRDKGPQRVYNQFELPASTKWNQQTFEGDAYPSYSWGCNIAEVEIDSLTLEISVPRVYATYDIGRLINPMLAKGQIEGGLVQALGYAIMEKMDIRDGMYDANRMQTYVVPTMKDVPIMEIEFLEFPYTHMKPGAKGVGEVPMDGLAPAIANAVYAATGVRITSLPITPEKLASALVGDSAA